MGSQRGFPKQKCTKGCPDGYELREFKVKFEKGKLKGREIKRHYCKKVEEKEVKKQVKAEIKKRTESQKTKTEKKPKKETQIITNPKVSKEEIESNIEESKEKSNKKRLAELRIERKKLESKKKESKEAVSLLERTPEEIEREKKKESVKIEETNKQKGFQERVFGYNIKEYKERDKVEKQIAKERALDELNKDYEDNIRMSQNLRKSADELVKKDKIDNKKRDQIHQSLIAIERDFTKKKTDLENQIKLSDYQNDIKEKDQKYKDKRKEIFGFARNMNSMYNVQ